MSSRVLNAVAWPYANGPRHIGHVSGFGVPSDVFSRYQRMAGNQVLMVSGTDEHGTPILVQAEKEGVSPRELADRYNRMIVEDLRALGLSYDLFTRTTTRNHYEVAQELFRTVHRNGYLLERTTKGAISPSTGRTLPDRYIEGTCPICGYEHARGDQCDNCGNQLDPVDLINPRSKINGETPKFMETEQYFRGLPAFTEVLRKWLVGKTGQWRPNVLNFSLNLLDELRPRAITRDLDWGVPVPLEGWVDRPDKKLYVWFDAVVGYLSASVEWARRTGDPDAWRAFWQTGPNGEAPDAYYFMGKDNIVFHSEIWPAMLLGYDGKGEPAGKPGSLGALSLPHEVVSSEFLTMEGRKFSSSRAVVIYVRDFLSRYDADALRFIEALSRDVPVYATLLHVVNLNIFGMGRRVLDELCREHEQRLRALTKLFFEDRRLPQLRVRPGRPHEEILAEAEAEHAELIVMASPKPSRLRWRLSPATVERVVTVAAVKQVVVREIGAAVAAITSGHESVAPAVEKIVARFAKELVVAGASIDRIVACTARDRVGVRRQDLAQRAAIRSAEDGVVAAEELVVTIAAQDEVVARAPVNAVHACATIKDVVAVVADDAVVECVAGPGKRGDGAALREAALEQQVFDFAGQQVGVGARHRVMPVVHELDNDVEAAIDHVLIVTRAARQDVVARTTVEAIVATKSGERVRAVVADDLVAGIIAGAIDVGESG